MQTIPDSVLAKIAEHRPHLSHLIAQLHATPELAPQLERTLATTYLLGETRLSAKETWYLAQVSYGGPWGGDWLSTSHAAELSGYDDAHLRRLANAGRLPAIKRGKTWYVQRDAVLRLPKAKRGESEVDEA